MTRTVEFKYDIGTSLTLKSGGKPVGEVCGLYYDEFEAKSYVMYYSDNQNNHITMYEDDLKRSDDNE